MDENILIENLDQEALSKILLHQIDLLSIGEGDMDLIRKCSKRLEKIDPIPKEAFMDIIKRCEKKYVTIIDEK